MRYHISTLKTVTHMGLFSLNKFKPPQSVEDQHHESPIAVSTNIHKWSATLNHNQDCLHAAESMCKRAFLRKQESLVSEWF